MMSMNLKSVLLVSKFVWVILRSLQLPVKAVAFFSAGRLIEVIRNKSWITQGGFMLAA